MTVTPVILLGSTSSIGTQTLDVIRRHPDKFTITGIAAGGANLGLLKQQVQEFAIPQVAVADKQAAKRLAAELPQVEVLAGVESITQLAGSGDAKTTVVNGITGSIGLGPTLAAVSSGAKLALANKESLVAGGHLVKKAQKSADQIVPVDSEHSALAQALRAGSTKEVAKLWLTASGGAFRGRSRAELAEVTAAQALQHPNWSMGPVVTINSASLMNKALEVIEAYWLFNMPLARIGVVVHAQSLVHSMVEFWDGSTIAQISVPDMRLPIALGLSYPDRLPDVVSPLSWDQPQQWTFEPVDEVTFPAIKLAREAVQASVLHPAVMNAANEEAVAAFLANKLNFLEIIEVVTAVTEAYSFAGDDSLVAVTEAENWARNEAQIRMLKR